MKIKNLFAILLALTLLTVTFVMPVSAKNETNSNNDIEIIINDDVSEETKAKIERHFATGIPVEDDGASYGITCTLLGHKTKISSVSVVTHKVRATSPRCKKETYNYEECTRCEYNDSTLIATEYIICCS